MAFLEKLNFIIPCKSLQEFYQIELSVQKASNLITEVVPVLVITVAVVLAVVLAEVVVVLVTVILAVVVAISYGLTEVSGI